MKIIVGLGNPGKEYERTRHNAGFLFLDFLKESQGFPPFEPSSRWKGSVSAGLRDGKKVLLLKPETFMNRSGESVSAIMSFFKIPVSDIVVVHDDLDIAAGSFKIGKGSGAAGHNGVSDLIEKLGTKEFTRVRIGIGRPPENVPADVFVLSPFSDEELIALRNTFLEIEKNLDSE
ncbi:MAG: aminoacyl-tRNA hydrolase [Candidatus Moraniibacteriota bacterium]